MKRAPLHRIAFVCLLVLSSLGFAKVTFEVVPFDTGNFRDINKLAELCAAPAASSFWCQDLTSELTLIPTKSVDYFFNDAGEIVAVFSKQQKGQNFVTNDGYKQGVDNGQNLIPISSTVPGGAVLLDGEYTVPEVVSANWERTIGSTDVGEVDVYLGTFQLQIGDVRVDKTIQVSNVAHTLDVTLQATHAGVTAAAVTAAEASVAETNTATADSDEPVALESVLVQYALPGIAKTGDPILKIGQGEGAIDSKVSQPIVDPAYISFQTSNARGNAIILKPETPGLEAQFYAPNLIALQSRLEATPDASALLDLEVYSGANELVRYYQEGYKDLPGLFKPNILGQLSLGILWVLQRIHEAVGSWGLAIIVLTLVFRALIWPLISTQTRSMYAMQRLQPKLKEIQTKYKDDREEQTKATMELYKTEGVNPAGGCLPMLVQMPLFIILWRVFANFEFNEGFLWIPDLGQADPFYILPVLYIGVIFAQSYFMAQGNKQSLQQQLLMNGVFLIFIINFPAGVTLYYVVSMLVQVLQYFLIQRSQKTPALAVAGGGTLTMDAPVKKPKKQTGGKKSSKSKAKTK